MFGLQNILIWRDGNSFNKNINYDNISDFDNLFNLVKTNTMKLRCKALQVIKYIYIFSRLGVAGAVLQSTLLLIHSLIERSFCQNIFQTHSIPNRKG